MTATANRHKVPVKQWLRWSEHARRVFNAVMHETSDQGYVNAHPDGATLSRKAWKTVRWNMAWIAADALDETGVKVNIVVDPSAFRLSKVAARRVANRMRELHEKRAVA